MADNTALVVLPLLQGWDGIHLSVRLLLIPRGNPFTSLDPTTPTSPNFPNANLKFNVHLSSIDALPKVNGGDAIHTLTLDAVPTALEAFNGILSQITLAGLEIDPSPPGAGRVEGTDLNVHKHLPASYRETVGTVSDSPLFPKGKTYSCMLKERTIPSKYVKLPAPSKKIAWGRLISALLRNPKLAEAAGLVRAVTIPMSSEMVEHGTFVFLTVAATSDAPKLSFKTFAARISRMKAPQDLFTPVLFPIQSEIPTTDVVPVSEYVDIYAEAEDYDDGWAKAVHCTQPQQLDPMKDAPDGTRPATELGIRLGWDDEQVTIWLDRQMDPANIKIDSPIGIQGYRIDVRSDESPSWHSLVRAKGPCIINGKTYAHYDGDKDELGVEIHPSQQHDIDDKSVFWLPTYFTSWYGSSLVSLDTDRIRLLGGDDRSRDDQVRGVKPEVALVYGKIYTFRVRLMDHTGGGPTLNGSPSNPGLSPTATTRFRRWIRPLAPVFISKIPVLAGEIGAESNPESMEIKRPRLGYPSVVCTGHYSDPIALLLQNMAEVRNMPPGVEKLEPSLPDPDVNRVEISVWISTLTQDPLATDNSFMKLYTTVRNFGSDLNQSLVVKFAFSDVHNIFDPIELPQGWNTDTSVGPLLLPTARTIRLRVVALCRDDPKYQYFGAEDVRRSPSVLLSLRKNAISESDLLVEETASKTFNAYFLQPNATSNSGINSKEAPVDVASRLATIMGVRNKGMTMYSMPGERIVFGCSGAFRHTLGPDKATITFASETDLIHRWIVVFRLILKRDWTWDGLQLEGLNIKRDGKEIIRFAPNHNVNHDALIAPGPDRATTTLVIFDAIDPDSGISVPSKELHPKYSLTYSLVGMSMTVPYSREFAIDLPITAVPRQTPRVVSSGIAMSPYVSSDDYSTTDEREKVLWIEFDEPILDSRDSYFCRVLRNAPDPLLTSSSSDRGASEPSLPISAERILRIIPDQSNDLAGLDAMQPMSKSVSSDRHYTVPLPAGMTPSSPELFGFFTYEFRVGHFDPKMWTTAQGRFGGPLRCSGVQHPPPQLTCSVSRSDTAISVSASSAISVDGGLNVTPWYDRTRMIVLLYAQAFQITSRSVISSKSSPQKRNILLFTREAFYGSWGRSWSPGVQGVDPWGPPTAEPIHFIAPPPRDRANEPKTYATAVFTVDEINSALDALGLWRTTSLSALAVEMLPQVKDEVKKPLGADIGRQRILRTSTLAAVPSRC